MRTGYFVIGKVGRRFGVSGSFRVHLMTDREGRFGSLREVFIGRDPDRGRLAAFNVERVEWKGAVPVMKVEGVSTPEDARALVNNYICLPLAELPDPGPGEVYEFELEGMRVVDEERGELGTVQQYHDFNGNYCLRVLTRAGKEWFLPFRETFIEEIDRGTGLIRTRYPEGVLDYEEF